LKIADGRDNGGFGREIRERSFARPTATASKEEM